MHYYPLEKLINLTEGYRKTFVIDGHKLLLLHHHDHTYLIENVCPHMGMPLQEGHLEGDTIIRCPFHGFSFDLITGKHQEPDEFCDQLKRYTLVYHDNEVGVEL